MSMRRVFVAEEASKMGRKVIQGAVGGIGLLLVAALLCPVGPAAKAEDMTTTRETSTMTRTLVRPVLSVALSPLVEMEVIPTSDGTVSQGIADLQIATNSENGFAVLMQGVRGTDMTSLTTNDKIATITEEKTLNEFANNSWGYYIGENEPTNAAKYNPIPGTTTEITSTTTSTENQSYKVAFGTKINTALTAGTYSNEVLISVVANPLQIAMLEDLQFMQDMTPEICAATTSLEATKELVDIRDNKTYKVAKLKDGNCWMQEDLKLSLSTDGLSAATTDIDEDWNENSEYPPVNTSVADTVTPDVTSTQSWERNGLYWYTFNAATAGHGAGVTENLAIVTGSICPKGWSLPIGGSSYDDTSGSLVNLVKKYGVALGVNDTKYATILGNAPLSFVLSGNVQNGKYSASNTYGPYSIYWASVSSGSTSATGFGSNTFGYASGSSNTNRSWGNAVRCMTKGN